MTLNHPTYRPGAAVVNWLRTFPGSFGATTPQIVMAKAYKASGLASTMAESVFAKVLAGRGFKPTCIFPPGQARPALYRLALPAPGPGVGRMT